MPRLPGEGPGVAAPHCAARVSARVEQLSADPRLSRRRCAMRGVGGRVDGGNEVTDSLEFF